MPLDIFTPVLKRLEKAIKFAPYGRRTLASSRRLWRRYVFKEHLCAMY